MDDLLGSSGDEQSEPVNLETERDLLDRSQDLESVQPGRADDSVPSPPSPNGQRLTALKSGLGEV